MSDKKFKRHFRIYLVNNHPAYIVDEEGNKYIFHRVTSSETSGGKMNWRVYPNPDKTRKSAMYIVKKQQKDKKKKFSKETKDWNFNGDFIKKVK